MPAWKDIWGSGQGIAYKDAPTVDALVTRLSEEFRDAILSLYLKKIVKIKKIDLYFLSDSYSYLILPRMLKLKSEYDIKINFKIVPLSNSNARIFKNKGPLLYRIIRM